MSDKNATKQEEVQDPQRRPDGTAPVDKMLNTQEGDNPNADSETVRPDRPATVEAHDPS